MNNYKIKVNNEAESKEAQELFFELGYKIGVVANKHFPVMVVAHDCGYGPVSTTATRMNHERHKEYKELTLPQLRDLVAKSKPTEQVLISGADALRALADGKEVEYFSNADYTWKSIFKYHPSLETIANNEIDINHKFRLKPRTITLNVEIPAPFEPKDGEIFWFVSPYTYKGYDSKYFVDDCTGFLLNGVWRTEEEIKQVVEALRGGIKG